MPSVAAPAGHNVVIHFAGVLKHLTDRDAVVHSLVLLEQLALDAVQVGLAIGERLLGDGLGGEDLSNRVAELKRKMSSAKGFS